MPAAAGAEPPILCIGARNGLDEAAAAMLAHLLSAARLRATTLAARRRCRPKPGAAWSARAWR